MQRGSDTHGPRLDDEMAHEVEGMVRGNRPSRAEEWRDPEPAAEDDPDVRGWHAAPPTDEPETET
jgi:hypothetical protein